MNNFFLVALFILVAGCQPDAVIHPPTDTCATCRICSDDGECAPISMCCSLLNDTCSDPCLDGDYLIVDDIIITMPHVLERK